MTDISPTVTIRCDWKQSTVRDWCETTATYPRRIPASPEAHEVMMTWWFARDGRHFCPEHKDIAKANLNG